MLIIIVRKGFHHQTAFHGGKIPGIGQVMYIIGLGRSKVRIPVIDVISKSRSTGDKYDVIVVPVGLIINCLIIGVDLSA